MGILLRKMPLENGGDVLIEVHEVEGEEQRIGLGSRAVRTFEEAWDSVSPAISALAKKLADGGPTETQIKFGIKIGSDLNAIIASARGEANFEVTLTWKPQG
jgi:hypothetical protein